MTQDEHRARHVELHSAFDELLADYLLHVPGSLPSKITATDLMTWSHAQTNGKGPRPNWRDGSIDATCSEVGAQVLLEGGGALIAMLQDGLK